MASPDPRGNPCGSRSAAARDAAETALWRMMSFYDTPLADLDAASAHDPGWTLPHVMRAGFLLSLTEASMLGQATAPPAHRARTAGRRAGTRACAPRSRAGRGRRPLDGRLPQLGRTAGGVPARRAGAAVGAAVGLLPRRCGAPARTAGARAARVGRGRPAVCACAEPVCLRPGREQPLSAGRRSRPPRAGRQPQGAVGGACGGACHGHAGPASTKAPPGCASTRPSGPRATASPATCGGTRACSGWRSWTSPARCAWPTSAWPASSCRSRCSAWTRPRCCGGCTCWAPT